MSEFKLTHSFASRKKEALNVLIKYPDRVPIILEREPNSHLPYVDKKKYLIPKNMTVGQFIYTVRTRIKLDATKALFLFTNNVLISTSASFLDVYELYKDEDMFLYLTYCGENTFGCS